MGKGQRVAKSSTFWVEHHCLRTCIQCFLTPWNVSWYCWFSFAHPTGQDIYIYKTAVKPSYPNQTIVSGPHLVENPSFLSWFMFCNDINNFQTPVWSLKPQAIARWDLFGMSLELHAPSDSGTTCSTQLGVDVLREATRMIWKHFSTHWLQKESRCLSSSNIVSNYLQHPNLEHAAHTKITVTIISQIGCVWKLATRKLHLNKSRSLS